MFYKELIWAALLQYEVMIRLKTDEEYQLLALVIRNNSVFVE